MLAAPTSLAITLSAQHAAASMRHVWQENTAIRFATSGFLGNAIFYGLDRAFLPLIVGASKRQLFMKASKVISSNAESISFFCSYLMSITIQHALNALIVFGLDTIGTKEMYLSSLASAYTAYFGTLCGSTILQSFLLQAGISRSLAFWSTIALGSTVNYLVLTALAARSKSQSCCTEEKQVCEENRDNDQINSTEVCFAFLGQSRLKSKRSD